MYGVLGVHRRHIQRLGLLRLMRMLGAGIDAQVGHLAAAQRTARHHALDRLLDDPLGELARHDRAGGAFLDAADIAGVVVVDFLLQLVAGQQHLGGVDDDDVVAAIHMGRVGGLVLAAQAHGDDRGQPADHQPFGVDQDPLLLDLGGLGRVGFHGIFSCEDARRIRGSPAKVNRKCRNSGYFMMRYYNTAYSRQIS